MPRAVILGGGVTGLAAANRLQELARESSRTLEITLLEREAVVGGCVQTLREDGFVMELGADSLLVDKRHARRLIERLNLESEIVDVQPAYRGARIVHRGRLREIPADFRLFAPRSLPALLRSRIFSARGIARAALEPFVPRRKSTSDETLASFVRRRFGREVLERLAQPLVGGIYSGDPARLSMQATLPQFVEYERQYGSVIRGMRANSGTPPPSMRLASLRGGLAALIDALHARVAPAIRTNAAVSALHYDVKAGWHVELAGGETLDADAVVCALPAPHAAGVLRGVDRVLSDGLAKIRCNSIATVNLAYDADHTAALPPATGFLVPRVEGRDITAATFSSQKYPGRAPSRASLLRAFIGGALQPELVSLASEELAAIASREICELAHISQPPKRSVVSRWRDALPEYGADHRSVIVTLKGRAARFPGLTLAGCAYEGVGIPDCIASGEAAAESVFGYISRA
jgi:oxygen-dependent protoporphyrinogen oxidase